MKHIIALWNWPKSRITRSEANILGKSSSLDEDSEFVLLEEEFSGEISEVDTTLVDYHLRFKKNPIDPNDSTLYSGGVRNVRPSYSSYNIQLGNILFTDRVLKYPWTKGIVRRFKAILSIVDDSHTHVVFISGGILPTEIHHQEIKRIVGDSQIRGTDIVVFRDHEGRIISDMFIVSKQLLKSILENVSFTKGGINSYDSVFGNMGMEEFIHSMYLRTPRRASISSEALMMIGTWKRPEVSLSLHDPDLPMEEKLHVLKNLSINSIFLSPTERGSFNLCHLAANLSQEEAEFKYRISLHENLAGQAGDIQIIHEGRLILRSNEHEKFGNLIELRESPRSYIEVNTETSIENIVLSESYRINLNFPDLHSMHGLKGYSIIEN